MTGYVETAFVKNFTGINDLAISGDVFNKQPLVHLSQAAAGLKFQHSMTIEQAEELCRKLKGVAARLREFSLAQGFIM